jgi:hypothetical protein
MTPDDPKELRDISERLERERPVPRASFRGDLRRALLAMPATPPRIRLLITAYAGAGSALLLVALAGIAGAGPLSS